jgi:hypothetical protein
MSVVRRMPDQRDGWESKPSNPPAFAFLSVILAGDLLLNPAQSWVPRSLAFGDRSFRRVSDARQHRPRNLAEQQKQTTSQHHRRRQRHRNHSPLSCPAKRPSPAKTTTDKLTYRYHSEVDVHPRFAPVERYSQRPQRIVVAKTPFSMQVITDFAKLLP